MFEINFLFHASLGCRRFQTMHPQISPCTPLVYSYDKWVNKREHIGCTCPKNVRPASEMCAWSALLINTLPYITNNTLTKGKVVGFRLGHMWYPHTLQIMGRSKCYMVYYVHGLEYPQLFQFSSFPMDKKISNLEIGIIISTGMPVIENQFRGKSKYSIKGL